MTSNSETATTDPGPLSIALALSTTPNADTKGRLTVDLVEHKIVETSNTLSSVLFDGSALSGGTWTPGTVGCYLYFKNASTTATEDIYIAIVSNCNDNDASPTGTDAPNAPAASGTTALDETTNVTLRTMTLKPGEFAFFPWDYTGDIYYEAATGTPALEYWRFDKA